MRSSSHGVFEPPAQWQPEEGLRLRNPAWLLCLLAQGEACSGSRAGRGISAVAQEGILTAGRLDGQACLGKCQADKTQQEGAKELPGRWAVACPSLGWRGRAGGTRNIGLPIKDMED